MNVCTCEHGHENQRRIYPAGAKVVAISEIPSASPMLPVPVGMIGEVIGHCDDGRAYIRFDDESAHTFHFPDDYIRLKD